MAVGFYICSCVAGYANGICDYTFVANVAAKCAVVGGTCDVDVDECISNPCKNGAACLESSTAVQVSLHAFSCTCANGFTNGRCTYSYPKQYTVLCSKTEGGTCDTDLDECASDPCWNLATCSDSSKTTSIKPHAYACTCVPGFSGDNCRDDVNECLSHPCKHGATCVESKSGAYQAPINTYNCLCVAGYAKGLCAAGFIQQYAASCNITGTPVRPRDCDPHPFACVWLVAHCILRCAHTSSSMKRIRTPK